MSEEEKEAIEQLKSWRKYIIEHKDRVNKANDIEFYLRTALNLIEKQNNRLEQLEKENKKLTEARNWYFKHTVNKAVTPEMLHKILRQDYIPKSVIREKIEKLDKCSMNFDNAYWVSMGAVEKIAEELLGGSNE